MHKQGRALVLVRKRWKIAGRVDRFFRKSSASGRTLLSIERAAATMREIGQDAAVQERFLRAGAKCVWSTPSDVLARVERERPTWREVVRISGARLD